MINRRYESVHTISVESCRENDLQSKRSADSVRLEVPGHEGFDFGCGPALSNAGQGLREPVERIDAIHFAGLCRPANYAEHLFQRIS